MTSGPLVKKLPAEAEKRDIPKARHKPESQHGFKAEETKEGNI